MERPNLELLKEIAYKYYPKGLEEYEDGYDKTDENIRLNQKINFGRKMRPEWGKFMARLNELGFETEDMSFFKKDRCLSCRFYRKEKYAEYSILCMSMLIPSFLFYHNKQTPNGFAAELELAPAIISEKAEIIKHLNLHFGELYEFPYNHASIELKNVNYGNNGRVKRIEELTGFSAITGFNLFNAFFSDIYIFG